MSCCDETTARVPASDVSQRSLFKGAALVASVIPAARSSTAEAQGKPIKLAYCSQLLCGVPYEVARSGGQFKAHGLDVQLVYTRGGNAAMQALVGGAVDYAATALDVAVQAYANVGADIRRFAVTGRLPLFAVVTAPNTASQIQSIKDLEGRTVGISRSGMPTMRSRFISSSRPAPTRRRSSSRPWASICWKRCARARSTSASCRSPR